MKAPAEILSNGAQSFGGKTALVTDSRTLSYSELDQLADRVAAWLRAQGLQTGDRVSIYSENRWEWIVCYHGILKAGCVVNPLNVMLTPAEVVYATADCGARAVFGSGAKLSSVSEEELKAVDFLVVFDGEIKGEQVAISDVFEFSEDLADDVDAATGRDMCSIAYTSGTTGHPKGAMQSAESVLLNCAYTAAMHSRNQDDIVVTALPAPHVYGNVAINSTFISGGTVRLLERFDPATAIREMVQHRATMFEGVPTMYSVMLGHEALKEADLSSLTRSTVGGQTIASSVIEAWEARTEAPLLELWGMTELSGLGTTHALHAPNVHGSIGVSLPGTQLRVVSLDGGGSEVKVGEPGELVVRGPLVTLGYYGNDKATREVINDEGWLRTGDVAYQTPDHHYVIVDRVKDVILTGGYNIYPAELERVLVGHPAVSLAAVGPVADEIKGELARAYIVLSPDATVSPEGLIEYCRPHLAAYKLPRSIQFVDALPMTSSGKIMRRKLRDLTA